MDRAWRGPAFNSWWCQEGHLMPNAPLPQSYTTPSPKSRTETEKVGNLKISHCVSHGVNLNLKTTHRTDQEKLCL